MFTSCPECGTVFRLTAGDLRVAEGFVRFGHCAAIFNALQFLAEEPPADDGPGEWPATPQQPLEPEQSEELEEEAAAPPEAEEEPEEAPGHQPLSAYTAEDWLAGPAGPWPPTAPSAARR